MITIWWQYHHFWDNLCGPIITTEYQKVPPCGFSSFLWPSFRLFANHPPNPEVERRWCSLSKPRNETSGIYLYVCWGSQLSSEFFCKRRFNCQDSIWNRVQKEVFQPDGSTTRWTSQGQGSSAWECILRTMGKEYICRGTIPERSRWYETVLVGANHDVLPPVDTACGHFYAVGQL